jgi:hypothetical protein
MSVIYVDKKICLTFKTKFCYIYPVMKKSTRDPQSNPIFPEVVPSYTGRRPSGLFSYTHDREFERRWNRCRLCNCPILDYVASSICLGCTVDQAVLIQLILEKKASKTSVN